MKTNARKIIARTLIATRLVYRNSLRIERILVKKKIVFPRLSSRHMAHKKHIFVTVASKSKLLMIFPYYFLASDRYL